MALQQQFATIDRAMLTPLVRQALDRSAVEVCDWTITPLGGGVTDSVYRVAGTGDDRGTTVKWLLLLKTVPRNEKSVAPAFSKLCEVDAYRSGFLDHLPGGLAVPRCYGTIEQPHADTIWLWLEEIIPVCGSEWGANCYMTIGRNFGRFNGSYLAGEPLPAYPWLRQSYERT